MDTTYPKGKDSFNSMIVFQLTGSPSPSNPLIAACQKIATRGATTSNRVSIHGAVPKLIRVTMPALALLLPGLAKRFKTRLQALHDCCIDWGVFTTKSRVEVHALQATHV